MDFYEVFDQVVDLLRDRGRVTYRALKLQFKLDDESLETLKDELIYAQQLAVDEDDRVLVFVGDTTAVQPIPTAPSTPESVSSPTPEQEREPLSYTPPHLAEKILRSKAALQGERKQVTVFFCDIANSTPLAERLGAERMHSLLNQFFELALEDVHRYEGTINQFLGDGFMALFGAPIAHEDHARRAVLAAVGLRHRLNEGSDTLGEQYGVEVKLRMGLHAGTVVVGAIGDNLRMDYTAIGDTTNVASRLQGAANPGQIVISEATHRLIEGYASLRSLGELSLKGKTEPIPVWEILGVSDARSRIDVEAERGLTPFMGRERELQLLIDSFGQAQKGQGRFIFIVGEAGLGKSRLLLETRRRLEVEATWLEGRAMSFGRSFAFHPVIDLLKRRFHIEEDDPETAIIEKITQHVLSLSDELRPILPYLRYLLGVDPGDPTVQTMNPQLRRAEIFGALRQLILRAAEVRPQVLVFEDLHWMDQATEAFLRFIADSIPTSRVLCLFTYRPGYTHPFGERTFHTRLVLPTLSTADSVHMAQAMLGTGSLPTELEALIAQKAEGNPFFVEEVVKSLQETGVIRRQGDRYMLTRALDEIIIPNTIQDVLMARIDRLEESPKKALQLASVIGREFTHRLLDRLADLRERTETYLQELKAIELIYEKSLFPELVYMFKHALTQDVAYNSLLEQRRQELHRLIGQAIEELYGDRLAEQYEVLAYHFAKGEVWDKALAYFCKAAEKAAQTFAIREAVALYDEAFESADHLGATVDVGTLMTMHQARAGLFYVLSDFARARAESEKLLTLARQETDPLREGAALADMAFASTFGHNFDQALDDARQAIEIAKSVNAKPVLASAYSTSGFVHTVTGRHDQAKQELSQALSISQSVGAVTHQSLSLSLIGFLKNWEGEYTEGTRLISDSLQIAREHQLLIPLLQNLFYYGVTLVGKGDFNKALAVLEEGLSLAEKVGAEVYVHRLLNSLGWLYIELGDLPSALDFNQRGAERSRAQGAAETIANAELNLADIFLAQGDLTLAQELLDGVHRLVKDPATSPWNKHRYSIHLFASLGDLWLAQGNPAQAQEFASQCLEGARRFNFRKYITKGLRLQGEIAFVQRQWNEAEEWLRQALSLAQAIGNPTQLWKTHLAMGHLHTEAKRPNQAQKAYHAAREVTERIKTTLQNPELRARLEHSPVIQRVYDLSASDERG